jgi:hypothetical protein
MNITYIAGLVSAQSSTWLRRARAFSPCALSRPQPRCPGPNRGVRPSHAVRASWRHRCRVVRGWVARTAHVYVAQGVARSEARVELLPAAWAPSGGAQVVSLGHLSKVRQVCGRSVGSQGTLSRNTPAHAGSWKGVDGEGGGWGVCSRYTYAMRHTLGRHAKGHHVRPLLTLLPTQRSSVSCSNGSN